MALFTFPLAFDEFLKLARVNSSTYDIPPGAEILQDANGEVVTAEYGSRLWEGSFSTYALNRLCAAPLRSRLELLRGPNASFLWRDPFYKGPASDPGGVILGGHNVTITGVDPTKLAIGIAGLPASYKLTAGDLISWGYGTPTRYALHRIAQDATATAAGVIAQLVLSSPVRNGTTGGEVVQLVQPTCKARLLPMSVTAGEVGRRWNSPISFQWRQTLR